MPLPPFFWPAQLTCPLDPKRATGQTPHYPSGSSWHTVRKRHERPLHESPRPAKLHFWMCPGVTRESHGDPRTELGLLRAQAHLSMTVPCKSDLVLSIWHPNATRAPNAPHSHTRETQGSAQVFTRGTSLYNKQPLEDRNMEPGCILVRVLFPGVGQRHTSGKTRLLHAGSPAQLTGPENRSVSQRAVSCAARPASLTVSGALAGFKAVPRWQIKGQRGSQRPSCHPSKNV